MCLNLLVFLTHSFTGTYFPFKSISLVGEKGGGEALTRDSETSISFTLLSKSLVIGKTKTMTKFQFKGELTRLYIY